VRLCDALDGLWPRRRNAQAAATFFSITAADLTSKWLGESRPPWPLALHGPPGPLPFMAPSSPALFIKQHAWWGGSRPPWMVDGRGQARAEAAAGAGARGKAQTCLGRWGQRLARVGAGGLQERGSRPAEARDAWRLTRAPRRRREARQDALRARARRHVGPARLPLYLFTSLTTRLCDAAGGLRAVCAGGAGRHGQPACAAQRSSAHAAACMRRLRGAHGAHGGGANARAARRQARHHIHRRDRLDRDGALRLRLRVRSLPAPLPTS